MEQANELATTFFDRVQGSARFVFQILRLSLFRKIGIPQVLAMGLALGAPALSLVLGILWPMSLAEARNPAEPASDFTEASLEELMNIKVTSASKKEEKLSKVAAAMYVITQEDIRRSGATTIPDLLRMVPGLDVAQIDQNSWAISARGFNDKFANKLLVLIDGRTVYDPGFSGTFWNQQMVPLEDIDRIEVIRGPGAAVWGANAVNGVINIITKPAQATQGGLARIGGGNTQFARGLVQYGGRARKGAYRVYSQYDRFSNLDSSYGGMGADGWHALQGGFRSDWDLSNRDSFTLQGDLLKSRTGETSLGIISLLPPVTGPRTEFSNSFNSNLLGRWNRTFSSRSETALQVYYNGINQTIFGVHGSEQTFDLDFQHHWIPGSRHDFVWGGGYRFTTDEILPGYGTALTPPRRAYSLFSGFVQDEIELSNSIWLTLGTKLEHNAFTGPEVQPTASLLWSPDDRQAAWISLARAVRQPSRGDMDVRLNEASLPGPNGLPVLVSIFGNPQLRSEELLAYEAGYRRNLNYHLSFDMATFYNVYHHLRTSEPQAPFFDPGPILHIVAPLVFANKVQGHTYGAELSGTWSALDRWRLTAGYSWLGMRLRPDFSSLDPAASSLAGYSPRHQLQVRSNVNLTRNLDFDTSLYYVARLPGYAVPAYTRVDSRLGWRAGESIEFSIIGQNLFNPHHLEFGPQNDFIVPTLASRNIFGSITWRF